MYSFYAIYFYMKKMYVLFVFYFLLSVEFLFPNNCPQFLHNLEVYFSSMSNKTDAFSRALDDINKDLLYSVKNIDDINIDNIQYTHNNLPQRIKRLLYTFGKSKKAPIKALFALYESREVLPEGGVVRIVGPGINNIEWFLPLIARDDITIIIHEKDVTMGSYYSDASFTLIYLYFMDILNDKEPFTYAELLKSYDTGAESVNKIYAKFKKQVILKGVYNKNSVTETGKHDIIFFNFPHPRSYYNDPFYYLSEGGFVWVNTELPDFLFDNNNNAWFRGNLEQYPSVLIPPNIVDVLNTSGYVGYVGGPVGYIMYRP